ncbi:MAG TPA: sugar phosphate isomerase/epimerase family protein [Chloroflexota bacterium]|nr:sugar phosphate isomerase/epimerase family protein [Chloroflexota bacterium]
MSQDNGARSAATSEGTGIHFAMGGAIFGELQPEHVEMTARAGFPGIEPYRGHIMRYVDRPQELKDLFDRHGLTMITCSNGGANQSTEFIDPARRQPTIDDHLAFARDFLAVFGCTHFKINMGARPAQGTSQSDIEAIASTITEIGKRTLDLGIRIAPHPHIWGPIERPEEVRALLDMTDPAIVWWIPDTAQLNLGGGDPVELMDVYHDRMAAVHWKDSKASYRGFTGPTPSREMHNQEILYKDLGAGGVDHPTIWQTLKERNYQGWVTLDLDPPRPNEGEGSIEDKILINRRYLVEQLGVEHL